jgi:hypothetical protein
VEVRDFRVEIGPGGPLDYEVSLRTPDGGEATTSIRLPVPAHELEELAASIPFAVVASAATVRRSISTDEQPVRRLGRMLYDALLADGGIGMLAACRNQADRDGTQLRIVLQIRAPELDRLPWEFLFDSRAGEYVCLSTPLIRHPQVMAAVRPLQVTAPLRILCMTASPKDQRTLAIAAEEQRLRDTLRSLEQTGRVELGWVEGQTWRALRHAMRQGQWHVFHFIGHGGFDAATQQGTIALADEDNNTYHLGADDLAMLLHGHPSLRLVLLNACDTGRANSSDPFSSVAGALIRSGVPAVLAMQYSITDRAALELGRTFYECLAEQCPVDLSVMHARQAVRLEVPGSLEWGTPVLYMRSADGGLFQFTDTAAVRPVEPQLPTAEAVTAGPGEDGPEGEDEESAELYTAALSALYTERWDDAIEAFRVLMSNGRGYKDAERRLAQAQRGKWLASLYAAGCAAAGAGRWTEAVTHLAAVVAAEADYRDAALRLDQARAEEEAVPLYAEVAALHRAGQWEAVLAVGQRIKALVPDKADPDGLVSSAQANLEAAATVRTAPVATRPAAPQAATRIRAAKLATLNAPAKVHSVTFNPGADRLALGCENHQACVLDLTGRPRLKVRHGRGDQVVRDVAYDPAGERLVTAGDDNAARIWDSANRNRLGKISHEKAVLGVAFSPDGTRVATGSADATARIWNAATCARLLRAPHGDKVPSVAFSPDGRLLATASWDGTARIWDTESGQQRLEVGHPKEVMDVAFRPDGRRFATAGWDGVARIWDAVSGEERLATRPCEHVWSVAFSPDGRLLATGGSDGIARIWDAGTGDLLLEVVHAAAVPCVSFSPVGHMFVTGSLDETAQLWRIAVDDDD